MITNVPNSDDFLRIGEELAHLAWDLILELYYQVELSELDMWDDDGTVREEFWASAQRTVATALVLTHQAADTLLMYRIAQVSPFLLLNHAGRWPSPDEEGNVEFGAFLTHDSRELPRVHDTATKSRLPEEFRSLLEQVRRARNRTVHTVDRTLTISPIDVLRFVLEIAHEFLGETSWIKRRWRYLKLYPLSVLHSTDHVDWEMCYQITTVVDLLEPNEVRRYFGFDKKQRRYLCMRCWSTTDGERELRTVLLTPNQPDAEAAVCYVCDRQVEVRRQNCVVQGCPGNVIEKVSDECLTCGEEQSGSAAVV